MVAKNLKKLNKIFILMIIMLFIVGGGFYLFSCQTFILQGVNYQVRQIKIPFYVKIIDFLSRHYHYKEILRTIIKNSDSDEQKLIKLFEWTHKNIRPVPEGFPIVDDHVYNIIIRGYGTDDQSADVFTTLCVYAGIPAFWKWVSPTNAHSPRYAVSFVKLNKRWLVFDSYAGNYFENKDGHIASIDDIISDQRIVETAANRPIIYGIAYTRYLENLSPVQNVDFMRPQAHMPWQRLIYELKNKFQIFYSGFKR